MGHDGQAVPFLVAPLEVDELVGGLEGEPPKNGAVDDGERGGGEADPEPQGDDGGGGEAGLPDKGPHCDPEVREQGRPGAPPGARQGAPPLLRPQGQRLQHRSEEKQEAVGCRAAPPRGRPLLSEALDHLLTEAPAEVFRQDSQQASVRPDHTAVPISHRTTPLTGAPPLTGSAPSSERRPHRISPRAL